MAGKVMSKRSARTVVDDEETYEYYGQKFTMYSQYDIGYAEELESVASTSTAIDLTDSILLTDGSTTTSSTEGSVDGDEVDAVAARMPDGPRGGGLKKAICHGARHTDQMKVCGIFKNVSLELPLQIDSIQTAGQPINFGVVVPGLYRSSYPVTEDYPFLKNLSLKTVITLVQKDSPAGYKIFLNNNGIKHHVFNMVGTKKEAIPVKTMKSILRLVLDRQNHPMLIHCNRGRHRTGCVVAVIRKLSGWEVSNVLDEYKNFAEPKVRDCDIDYITAFNPVQLSNLWATENHWGRQFYAYLRFAGITLFALVFILISCQELVAHNHRA